MEKGQNKFEETQASLEFTARYAGFPKIIPLPKKTTGIMSLI